MPTSREADALRRGVHVTTLGSIVNVINWLQVLASPHIYGALGRVPTRELLLRQVDCYLEYVRNGECFTDPTFPHPPHEQRERCALRLRSLLEGWAPPSLTDEVVAATRELLYTEGFSPPEGWDAVSEPDEPMAGSLVWS